VTPEALFLPCAEGQRFGLLHAAAGPRRGAIVYLHPLAEEMHKSRRMAALQARAFAAAGFDVLQIDLLGCGDSSGDFGDATWARWVEDALLASRWMRLRSPAAPLWLWGLRAGCLLAAEAARRLDLPAQGLLLWQPPASGKSVLQQFLRLRVLGESMAGAGRGTMAALHAQFAAGQPVDVAGYRVSADMARELEQAGWQSDACVGRVHCIEIAPRNDANVSPACESLMASWRLAGCRVSGQAVVGPAFWQTTEIEEAPALLDASVEALAEPVAA
jgi:exosortase A-associated hydrolase 2